MSDELSTTGESPVAAAGEILVASTLTDADRELLRRLTTGDLVGEFQAALDAVSAADPLIGGGESDDEAD